MKETTDIILQRIYINKEIDTTLSKQEMKDLLHIFANYVHFSLNGPVRTIPLTDWYWVIFENTITPRLKNKIKI